MTFIRLPLAASALVALGLAWQPAQADIVIGYGVGLTGQLASIGAQAKAGADAAVEDINAKGGINGEKIRLEVGDDACDPKQAVAVANQLVAKKVPVVLGHLCSGASIAASDVYAEENILMMTPSATSPALTERGLKNVFRGCGRDDQQGSIAGKMIAERFKGKKVAIVNDKQAYGKGMADEAEKAFRAGGGTPDLVTSVNQGERDFSALITRLKDAGIDVVYYGGYHGELGLIVRQARQQGLNAVFVGGDGLATDEYWAIAAEAANGTLFTFSPDAKADPAAKAVVERMEAKGVSPDNFTLYTYAAMQTLAQAIEKAKSTKFADLEKVMRDSTFTTIVGTFDFDAKGDLTQPNYVFYEWKDGKYVPAGF